MSAPLGPLVAHAHAGTVELETVLVHRRTYAADNRRAYEHDNRRGYATDNRRTYNVGSSQ